VDQSVNGTAMPARARIEIAWRIPSRCSAKRRLRFALHAEDGEADAGDEQKDGEGDGDFQGLFFIHGCRNRTDFRDVFFLVIGEGRMREADDASQK